MKLSSAWLYEQLAKEFHIIESARISGRDSFLRPLFWCGEAQNRARASQDAAGRDDGRRHTERGNTGNGSSGEKQRRHMSAYWHGHVCVIPVSSECGMREQTTMRMPDQAFCVFCLNRGGCGNTGTETRRVEYGAYTGAELCAESGSPYVCIEADGGAEAVLNCIQEAFDFCDAWEQDTVGLLAANAGIEKALEMSAEFLGNPLMVMGADYSLTAEAGMEKLPSRARLFIEDHVNVEYMNALMQDEEYQKLTQAKGTVLFPEYLTGCRSLNRNLFVDGQPTHRLVLTECEKPVEESCICILEALARHLEYQLSREAPASMKGDLETIFQKVLSDRTADYVQISRSLSAAGWNSQDDYLCMILQITYLNQKQLSTHAICRYIRQQLRDSVSFLYQDEVVSFFNLTRLKMTEEELAGKLVYFIRDSYLKAGYSRTMRGHMNLRRQYVQARTALDVGSRKRPYLWIHHFNQVALTYIIEQSTRRLPADMICHEGLLKLREHDQKNHSEYMVTLKTWLDQQRNATQAAKELFIHRSTFLYRMARIKEILHSDLEDPEQLFYLELSFRLLEHDEEKNHTEEK